METPQEYAFRERHSSSSCWFRCLNRVTEWLASSLCSTVYLNFWIVCTSGGGRKWLKYTGLYLPRGRTRWNLWPLASAWASPSCQSHCEMNLKIENLCLSLHVHVCVCVYISINKWLNKNLNCFALLYCVDLQHCLEHSGHSVTIKLVNE